jgi:hypothetical protein
VIPDRRPKALCFVAGRREVGADAVRGVTPIPIREGSVESRERPVRLAGVVPGILAGDRRAGDGVVLCEHRAGRLDLREQEAPEPAHDAVVAGVAGGLSADRQRSRKERRCSRIDLAAVGDRGPIIALE